MAGTIVFIFLLDHLPENIMDESLETIEVTHTNYSSLLKCDTSITDPLLQVTSRELEVLMIPKWLSNKPPRPFTKENLHENFLHTNKVLESSLEVTKDERGEVYKLDDYEHGLDKTDSIKDPKKAPILAAIFESLSNVTAQTCGGTVVAPHWVLTAASCINLLSNLNSETTNVTEKSVYTIIINATNPLIDGSAHNVTEIRLHPDNTTKPQVALMKIEPAFQVDVANIIDKKDAGMYVTVYGWAVRKDEADHDTMMPASFEAIKLSPDDCATYYNITADSSDLCLATTDEYDYIVSQLSWGGPVVSRAGGILAIARGDGRAPLAACPLADHDAWLQTIIHDK